MARSRNIKPGLFKNEILGVADPLYTIAFEGLWVNADREGRLEDRPLRLKAEIFPYRDVDMVTILDWLQKNKFVVRYKDGENRYIQIINFLRHQNPHKNEQPSIIPEFTGIIEVADIKPDKIGTTPVQEPISPVALGLIPSSLIPDSLSSDSLQTPLSGDARPQSNNFHKDVSEVIEFLNAKTGREYRIVNPDGSKTSTSKAVLGILKKGYSVQDCKTMIARKAREWVGDPKMEIYLRPKTLFAVTNFENYHGACVEMRHEQLP